MVYSHLPSEPDVLSTLCVPTCSASPSAPLPRAVTPLALSEHPPESSPGRGSRCRCGALRAGQFVCLPDF